MNNNSLTPITKALSRFFTLKTMITLIIVFTFCLQTLQGAEMSDAFIMIATSVITYYFCKNSNAEEKLYEDEGKSHKASESTHSKLNPDKSVGE